jgi:HEAT repeat protein
MSFPDLKRPIPNWERFLRRWSREWLGTHKQFASSVGQSKWLGYKPATERQIAAAEKRLGFVLPPSYKSFLQVSNGWRSTFSLIGSLRPAKDIEQLAVFDPALLDTYAAATDEGIDEEAYYSYTGETTGLVRSEHFQQTVIIADSAPGDSAIYLLNPAAVTEDGEWEAWLLAHWIPGVERYPSFAHLMLAEYHSFRMTELDVQQVPEVYGPYTGVAAPIRPRRTAERTGEVRRSGASTLDELVAQLTAHNAAARRRAAEALLRQASPPPPPSESYYDSLVTELEGMDKGEGGFYAYLAKALRRQAHERPRRDLIGRFAEVLRGDHEPLIRAAAAAMLGEHGDEHAIEILITALGDDPEVDGCVLTSLGYLSMYYLPKVNARWLAERLKRGNLGDHNRHRVLEFLGESGAPLALRVLMACVSADSDDDLLGSAALAAGKLGDSAVPPLGKKLRNRSVRVRAAAAAGLGATQSSTAIALLKKALRDADKDVRGKAKIAIDEIRSA